MDTIEPFEDELMVGTNTSMMPSLILTINSYRQMLQLV